MLHDPSKSITPPRPHSEHECGFHLLLKFFGLDDQFYPILPPSSVVMESKILSEDMWGTLRGMLLDTFEEADMDIELQLLYRGTRDGFVAANYHHVKPLLELPQAVHCRRCTWRNPRSP